MKELQIDGLTYETDGERVRRKHLHGNGYLYVEQLSEEIQAQIKEMYADTVSEVIKTKGKLYLDYRQSVDTPDDTARSLRGNVLDEVFASDLCKTPQEGLWIEDGQLFWGCVRQGRSVKIA